MTTGNIIRVAGGYAFAHTNEMWAKLIGPGIPSNEANFVLSTRVRALAEAVAQQAVPDDLRSAYERLKRSVESKAGFPESVEAERAFVLAAYEGIGTMLAKAAA